MEVSSSLSGMGIEDSICIDEYQMNASGDLTPQQLAAAFGDDYQQSYSSETFSHYSDFSAPPLEVDATLTCFERPTKQQKTTYSWNSCTTGQSTPEGSSSPTMLAFGSSSSPTSHTQYYGAPVGVQPKLDVKSPTKKNYTSKAGKGNKRVTATSTTSPAQDHILAERKRREKLSQQFIALSAIIPGLKKLDKASVLGDSIIYIKELQERMKALEEENAIKTTESVVFVKKIQIPRDENSSSTDENSINEPLPEIEAKISDNNILIHIHCEKGKGVLVKALNAIEKLNLSVVNSSVIPFGSSELDITILAEIEGDFNMAAQDLVKKLCPAFRRFM